MLRRRNRFLGVESPGWKRGNQGILDCGPPAAGADWGGAGRGSQAPSRIPFSGSDGSDWLGDKTEDTGGKASALDGGGRKSSWGFTSRLGKKTILFLAEMG